MASPFAIPVEGAHYAGEGDWVLLPDPGGAEEQQAARKAAETLATQQPENNIPLEVVGVGGEGPQPLFPPSERTGNAAALTRGRLDPHKHSTSTRTDQAWRIFTNVKLPIADAKLDAVNEVQVLEAFKHATAQYNKEAKACGYRPLNRENPEWWELKWGQGRMVPGLFFSVPEICWFCRRQYNMKTDPLNTAGPLPAGSGIDINCQQSSASTSASTQKLAACGEDQGAERRG